jgi:pentatricopeptide repeat protein
LRRIPDGDPERLRDRLVATLSRIRQFERAVAIVYDFNSTAATSSSEACYNSEPTSKSSSPLKQHRLQPDTIASMIDGMLADGRTEMAMDLYKYCRQSGYEADSRLFSSFIRGFARQGNAESARSFVEAKQQAGFPPSLADYMVVLKVLFSNKQVEQAEQWYAKHIIDRVGADGSMEASAAVTFLMIQGYSRNEMPEKSREWFDIFRNAINQQSTASGKPSTSPPAQDAPRGTAQLRKVWNAMLFAYARSNQVDEATSLYRQMQPAGIQPDIDTYNALILAFIRSRDVEMAKSIFEHLPEWNLRPSKSTYTMLIDGFMKMRQVENAVRWIDRMQADECSPDTVLLTTMIDGYSRNRMYSHSLDVYEDMKRLGIPLDIVACTAMLNSAVKEGDYQRTLRIYNDIKTHNFQLTPHTYSVIIYANGQQGDIEAAEQVFAQMKSAGIQPNIHAFNALLTGYLLSGDQAKAYGVLKQLKENQLQPTVATYAVLMELASKDGRCDNVLKYLNTLLKDESVERVSDRLISTVIDILGRHGHVEIVKMTFEALLAGSRQQPTKQQQQRKHSPRIEVRGRSWQKFTEVMIAHDRPELAKQAIIDMIKTLGDRKKAGDDNNDADSDWLDESQMSFILTCFRQAELWSELDEIFAALDRK